MSAPTLVPEDRDQITDLVVGGMTCAACAGRIERRLNRLDGVTATVNYATERARVTHPTAVDLDALIARVEAAGYTAAPPAAQPTGDGAADLRRRALVAAVLALPVLILAMVPAAQLRGWQWLSLALATPVVGWAGLPIHRAAWRNLRHRAATMDTLVSLGTLAAYGWSVGALVGGDAGRLGMRMRFDVTARGGPGALYLEVASAVLAFVLAGRYVEARARRGAGAAVRALAELGARDASVLRDGVETRVPVDQLAVGDEFVVRPGQRLATDGIVVAGASAVDASLLTGESVPVDVMPGDAVTGATVNAGGRLVVRATRVGAQTRLATIGRLVADAQTGKAAAARLADRVAAVFVPAVLGAAVLTGVGWLAAGGSAATAGAAAVAVLVVACPCALGLATPTALLVGTGRGAQLGVLLGGPEVLEDTRRVDTVVLDKTGTVTTGAMTLVDVVPGPGESATEVRRWAAAVEDAAEHPVARAVAAAVPARDRSVVTEVLATPGFGVRGLVEGRSVAVGRPDGGLPPELAAAVDAAAAAGRTAAVVAWDGRARGVLVVADTVKPTSAEAVGRLRALGLTPVLLTGDNALAARAVADAVGIDEVLAEVPPEGKVDAVARLQADGRVVAMVGDGANDAAALAAADLGIALGTGTDAAIAAGDLTLVGGDLRGAATAVGLARRTLATIRANLVWAFGYNVAAIPLAAAGFLNPVVAGAAMACSSLLVVGNSLRLRRWTP